MSTWYLDDYELHLLLIDTLMFIVDNHKYVVVDDPLVVLFLNHSDDFCYLFIGKLNYYNFR